MWHTTSVMRTLSIVTPLMLSILVFAAPALAADSAAYANWLAHGIVPMYPNASGLDWDPGHPGDPNAIGLSRDGFDDVCAWYQKNCRPGSRSRT